MDKSVIVVIMGLSVVISIGIFFANDDKNVEALVAQEREWLEYPYSEYMVSLQEAQKSVPTGACKALHEHQRNQPTETEAQRYSVWKLKNDELHAQCSVETIEQTITRLQEQLKKDHERWKKAKSEQELHVQS